MIFQDKEYPTHLSLFEVYRDDSARAAQLETAHFLKWKDVYLQPFSRRGNGNEFTAQFPAEAD